MTGLSNKLSESLNRRKLEKTYRSLRLTDGGIDFSSNDYLGLAANQELASRIHQRYIDLALANGSGGSRLISGNSLLTERLEEELAIFFQAESSLLFNSGYTANLALLSCLPKKGDTILYDELAHASIKDGVRLSLGSRFSFKHNNIVDLARRLQKVSGQAFVVVESVYSMDGDEAPLQELAQLCEERGAALLVDEAHSTGIYGAGKGLVCELGLQNKVFARIHTFGKAIGNHGASVVGTAVLRNYLINFARPFIYTTALPPHTLLSLQLTFPYLQEHKELMVRLKENIAFYLQLKQEMLDSLLPAGVQINSRSPIQAIVFPGAAAVKKLGEELGQQGFEVRPILSPTVPVGKERLRICLHTFNSKDEIKALVQALAQFLA